MDPEKRQALLEECKAIRVTDWHDALDAIGLIDRGLMDPAVRPLWRDIEHFSHCIIGFAFTVRYVPSSRAITATSPEEYLKEAGRWYGRQPKWAKELQPGDLIVLDGTGNPGCGFIGSNNAMGWLAKGAVGAVTNSGVRDTDELIKQRVPIYHNGFCRGIQPNRMDVDSYQKPIECGGVYVQPGDLVVADGDGVIAIPAGKVEDALPIAREIQQDDQRSRASLYEKLGLPSDFTLGKAARPTG